MAKKKKRKLVCEIKGNSRHNDTFKRLVKTPCECKKAFQRQINKNEVVKVGYFMSKDENGVRFSSLPREAEDSKTHSAVPCEELFVKRNSNGLRLIERWTNEKSFPGCQAVEDSLRAELLINNEHGGRIQVLRGADMPDFKKRSPLHDPYDESLAKTNIDEIYADWSIWDLICKESEYPAPTRNRIDHVFTDPRLQKELQKFLKSIPSEQRKPIRLYYLKNKKGLTMRDVAKTIGCSVSTLHERLKKSEEGFREFLKERSPEVILRKKTISP